MWSSLFLMEQRRCGFLGQQKRLKLDSPGKPITQHWRTGTNCKAPHWWETSIWGTAGSARRTHNATNILKPKSFGDLWAISCSIRRHLIPSWQKSAGVRGVYLCVVNSLCQKNSALLIRNVNFTLNFRLFLGIHLKLQVNPNPFPWLDYSLVAVGRQIG